MHNELAEAIIATWDVGHISPDMPEDHDMRMALIERCKVGAQQRANRGDVAGADRVVRLAEYTANQSRHLEHQAGADWCAALALMSRDPRHALSRFQAARRYYQSVGGQAEQGRILIGVAGLLGQIGRLQDAVVAIDDAERLLAPFPQYADRRSLLLLNRSDIAGRLGRYDTMLTDARASAIAAQGYGQRLNEAMARINEAVAAMALGRVAEAEQALEQALDLATSEASPELMGRVAVNQARLATARGALFEAVRLLQRARSDFQAAEIELDLATVAIEEAALAERLTLLYEAQSAARRAAKDFAQADLPSESVEALLQAVRVALMLGRARDAQRDLDTARSVMDGAMVRPELCHMHVALAAHPAVRRGIDARRFALVETDGAAAELAGAGLHAEALQAALIAADLAAALREDDTAMRYQTIADRARDCGLPSIEQTACAALGSVLPRTQAIPPLMRAVALISTARQAMPMEELKAQYLSGHTPLYGQLVAAQLARHQTIDACDTLLVAKGGLWADVALPAVAHEPDAAWLQAKVELQLWQEQLDPAGDPAYQSVVTVRVQQGTRDLIVAARQSTRMRPTQPLPDIRMVQARIPRDTTAVEYLIGADSIRACVLTTTGTPQWVTVGKREAVRERLDRLRLLRMQIVQARDAATRWHAAAAQLDVTQETLADLSRLLLAPLGLDPADQRILLAPDGLLFDVPWAALPYGGRLLGDYDLTLVPTLVVLALPHAPVSDGGGLALGHAGNPPLAHVVDELAMIRRHFPNTQVRVPAGSADLVWETAPRLLHVAAHGHINSRDPLLSRIDLADGPLLLGDALALPLGGTELMTLSACETGAVPERGGVALALAGAFLTAGAHATIAGLWQVDDATTYRFMDSFYGALAASGSVPQSIRYAQQNLRDGGDLHPYYWAAFQSLLRVVPTTT